MGDIVYDDRDNPQVNSSNAATIYEYSGSIAELLTEDIRDFPDFKFRNNAVFHFYCNDGVKYQVYTANNMFFRDVQLDNAFGGGGGEEERPQAVLNHFQQKMQESTQPIQKM